MTVPARTRKIDDLLDKARQVIEKDLFDAEARCDEALRLARTAGDFERMAEIVPILQQARRRRLDTAVSTKRLTIVDTSISEDLTIESGCYLVQPPLVGADSRRLRLAAIEARVPVAVVCREPITQLRLCPVVAICPGYTARTQVDPPADLESPDLDWFVRAMNELGDWSASTIDPAVDPTKRVDMLIERITALPEHMALHDALEEACRGAAAALVAAGDAKRK